ncbi:efflux RND transporter periplasmic adaptor subunit [Flavobacterium sedimenticola]|uniref:Efflux RND transporter periplasmic adaptor subunit n=1 Tax=Flavobacterium sedimenticola TaxID=3043286 RepID=A0ABT6XNX1_9FLAO|nr:efflux RND transporter periplasmic adaptor subunit [Flavobacterium sedimenticola]MDI9256771.1 efflux RND transporter periplasmic adaptor subunit [Flavobacterium sedimenticola]
MLQDLKLGSVFLAAGMLILTLNSCQDGDTKTTKEANSQSTGASALPVDVIVAQETDLNQEEVVVGTIVPNQEIAVVSEIAQKVSRIAFSDGSNVVKGQLLYKLHDADLKAKLKELKAELQLAQLNERRMERLLQTDAVRKQEYDDVATKLQAMKAQEEFLLSQLSKTEIRAPFSGRIGISKVAVGAYVTPGLDLVNLQDQSKVKIHFSVPEKYLLQVKKGGQIRFTTQLSTQFKTATINAVESGLEEANRSVRVQALTGNAGGAFKGGMSAKIHFSAVREGTKGIKIPSEALIPGENGYNVYIVVDGKAQLTPVTIANRSESEAIINSGIKNGDTIVITNILRLGHGMPVNAIPSK